MMVLKKAVPSLGMPFVKPKTLPESFRFELSVIPYNKNKSVLFSHSVV